MKSSELETLARGLHIVSDRAAQNVRERLELECKKQKALEGQEHQVFVESHGRLQETMANTVHEYLSDLSDPAQCVDVEFFAYVNSQLHPVILTSENTLVADTVTIYEPGGVDTVNTKE